MEKVLWIAEKKSLVIEAVLPVLPGTNNEEGHAFIQRDQNYFIWLDGHAFEQAPPEHYLSDDVPTSKSGRKVWRSEDLPIIPNQWVIVPKEKKRPRLAKLKELLKQCDVVYHLGDPDEEGQLLVDEALLYFGNRKPVKRVLINDYNETKVREALANIRDNDEPMFRGWYKWALARSRYDWLLGMNGTRAMTLRGRELGLEDVFPVGSVQTPLLYIVRERDRVIETFKPMPYFTIVAHLRHANGNFLAHWKAGPEQPGLDSDGRLIDKTIATEITQRVNRKTARITRYLQLAKIEKPPLPLSMNELQMDGFTRFGYTGKQVLDASQKLYETYKVATYPRSDNRYLSEAQHQKAPLIVAAVFKIRPDLTHLSDILDVSRKSDAFNDKKMMTPKGEPTPHHGIVPTIPEIPVDPTMWTDIERNVYDMIVRSYLAQFASPYEYLQTNIEVTIDKELFTALGKVPRVQGWKAVYAEPVAADELGSDEIDAKQALPLMQEGDGAVCEQGEMKSRLTTPPPRFDDNLLIDAMKNVHKYVSDEKYRKRLKEGDGIGTTATRGPMIQEMKDRQQLIPVKSGSKKQLTSAAARALIDALTEDVKDPSQAGVFKSALDRVASGELSYEAFMEQTTTFVKQLIMNAKNASMNVPVGAAAKIFDCPKCGKSLRADSYAHSCTECDFKLWHEVAGRKLSTVEIETLLLRKKTALLKGFRSRTGKKFSAALILEDSGKVRFEFDDQSSVAHSGESRRLTATCPRCQSTIETRGRAYACTNCEFQVWSEVAGRKLSLAEAETLIGECRTSLLSGFKNKAGQKFSAKLKLNVESGKVQFEFEDRQT